jgi:hypothetical protein
MYQSSIPAPLPGSIDLGPARLFIPASRYYPRAELLTNQTTPPDLKKEHIKSRHASLMHNFVQTAPQLYSIFLMIQTGKPYNIPPVAKGQIVANLPNIIKHGKISLAV